MDIRRTGRVHDHAGDQHRGSVPSTVRLGATIGTPSNATTGAVPGQLICALPYPPATGPFAAVPWSERCPPSHRFDVQQLSH
jgi:hypothetical protein